MGIRYYHFAVVGKGVESYVCVAYQNTEMSCEHELNFNDTHSGYRPKPPSKDHVEIDRAPPHLVDCYLSGSLSWEPLKSSNLKKMAEILWVKDELLKVSKAMTNYESDAKIPDIYSELRVTTYSEDDYYALLGDRKLLVEYVEQDDFPDCGRPKLSGLT